VLGPQTCLLQRNTGKGIKRGTNKITQQAKATDVKGPKNKDQVAHLKKGEKRKRGSDFESWMAKSQGKRIGRIKTDRGQLGGEVLRMVSIIKKTVEKPIVRQPQQPRGGGRDRRTKVINRTFEGEKKHCRRGGNEKVCSQLKEAKSPERNVLEKKGENAHRESGKGSCNDRG